MTALRPAPSVEPYHYAAVLDASTDAVMIISSDGCMLDCNPAAEQLYGYARSDALGQPVKEMTTTDTAAFQKIMAAVTAGQGASFEAVVPGGTGGLVETTVTLSPVVDHTGQNRGAIWTARDTSQHKSWDAELHQESKLESLGRLSAGLAHEINSPIQFVGDNARFLEEAYQELIRVVEVYRGLLDTSNPIGWQERQEPVREAEASIDFDYLQKEIPSAVEQTLEGIDRVSRIVRAMKTFSHPGHTEQAYADLNEALEATATVTRHQVKEVADLVLDLADLPPVRCNIADLNQVFVNLIVNAADAIEDTGTWAASRSPRAWRGSTRSFASKTPEVVSPTTCDRRSSTPSSLPRTSAEEAGRACRWPAASFGTDTGAR
jgi:two-component system NtrC family sensor kinase